MLIWFVTLILAGQPIGDLYVQPDVSPKQLQVLLKSGAPIHAYLDSCAFYVTKPGATPPPNARLLAAGIVPGRILFLTSRIHSLDEILAQNFPRDIRILYTDKQFILAEASISQRESLTALGLEYRMLRSRPLHIARPSQIPSEPQGLPVIHQTISHITSEYPMLYINTMADFQNRYTFNPRFQNAQMWAKDRFMMDDLDTSYFFYDCNSYNDTDYRGLYEDEDLLTWDGKINVRNSSGWVTYLTGLTNLGDYKYSADRSRLYICGSTARVGWNTIPNDYNQWEIKWTGGGSYLEGVYAEGNKIWAVGDPGLIKYSDDGGETWQDLTSGVQTWLKEIGKYHVGSGSNNWYFIVGTDGTVLRSVDGIQWEPTANLPLSGIDLYDIEGYESPNGTLHGEIVVVGSDLTIFTSADGGDSWQQRYYGMTGYLYDIDYKDERIWAIGKSSTQDVSVISDDYGLTWHTYSDNDTGSFKRISIDENDRDRAYACGDNGIYAWTNDKGDNWFPMPQPPLEPPNDKNIVAELPGETKPDEIIIVCAHEDGVQGDPPDYIAPAADDNASGSAAVIAIADQMSKKRFERTVRFILFSGEELGLLGSSAYACEMGYQNANIIAVLNADMIGYMDDAVYDFDICIVQSGIGAELQDFVIMCAEEYIPEIQTDESKSESSDHAPFSEIGYQATELIEHNGTGWNPYYHTDGDVPETLTPNLVVYGTRLYLATAMELAGYLGEREQPQPPSPPSGNPYIYPNPLHVGMGQSTFTFANLDAGTKVQIFTLSGSKVWETTADNITLSWSPNLASGIYLYTIEKDGKKFKGKLAIIK